MENIKEKTKKELQKILGEKREDLQTFRFHLAGGKVKNVKEGMTLRRQIARILTEINKK